MVKITIITIGKLKEKYFLEASKEYEKRLSAFCNLSIIELDPAFLQQNQNEKEIEQNLKAESEKIMKNIPKGAAIIPLCIEGKKLDSEKFAARINELQLSFSNICFIIGGSHGLHNDIKNMGNFKFSMSEMTFPHRLARIMLLEQIYRGFKINQGSNYHK